MPKKIMFPKAAYPVYPVMMFREEASTANMKIEVIRRTQKPLTMNGSDARHRKPAAMRTMFRFISRTSFPGVPAASARGRG